MVKSKYFYAALVALSAQTAVAQETYENAPLLQKDLNGTARYVGMGGAVDALGADISIINSNPAGIGLFRRSMASGSVGLVSQSGVNTFDNVGKKTRASFDQVGFVYAMRNNERSFINFAFNYHKSKNLGELLNVADQFSKETVNGSSQYISSQNKSVYQKIENGVFKSNKDYTYSYVDDLYLESGVNLEKDNQGQDVYVAYPATDYLFNRHSSGYISNYDFSVSGNVNDRFYWGLTFGIKDVKYRKYSEYSENIIPNSEGLEKLGLQSERLLSGTGFDMTFGVIFRPVATSPFRMGVSVTTPTWYDLTSSAQASLSFKMSPTGPYNSGSKAVTTDVYDFKFYTPWKFGLSLGHTVGDYLALGASYEYADYSGSDIRENDGYDYYGYTTSSSDIDMKQNIQEVLKGVSTLKLGLEYKPSAVWALRAGYNFISPMYQKNGIKNMVKMDYVASPGHVLTTSTDYTNWKATNRFTLGVGYNVGKVSLDLAYQYAVSKGDFNPFNTLTVGEVKPGDTATLSDNIANIKSVDNKRHQVLFTLGYKL